MSSCPVVTKFDQIKYICNDVTVRDCDHVCVRVSGDIKCVTHDASGEYCFLS